MQILSIHLTLSSARHNVRVPAIMNGISQRSSTVNAFVNRCQVALAECELGDDNAFANVRSIIWRLPQSDDVPTRAVLTGIANRVLAGVRAHISRRRFDPEAMATVTRTCDSPQYEPGWIKVARALALIGSSFAAGSITLRDAALQVGTSASYLDRLFRLHTGQTFLVHAREYRVRRAEDKLRSPQLSVKEVCYSCGYRSLATFQRDFKRVHALSPSAWRQTQTSLIPRQDFQNPHIFDNLDRRTN